MLLATSSTRRWKAGTPDRSTGTAKKARLPCSHSARSTRACPTRRRALAPGGGAGGRGFPEGGRGEKTTPPTLVLPPPAGAGGGVFPAGPGRRNLAFFEF